MTELEKIIHERNGKVNEQPTVQSIKALIQSCLPEKVIANGDFTRGHTEAISQIEEALKLRGLL